MNDVIRLLPDSVANQIAAGEVIQRPASVIKELVENAVDAGATEIRIYIKDAGRTLIQVIDNGCGMSGVDARMAFERHATSKISRADDLFRLHTMGFRGEALPSICAIAQIDIRTRRESDQMGTRLLINGSKVESQESVVCDKGTSISVRNLFFNVPARRKFLKSDNVELSNVMREFERLALVNNHIRMSIDTGNRQLDLRAATLHQRIHDIWKNNLKMQLLPVDVDTRIVKINGFISRPEYARRRNALQFLIVNGRNMRHPYFHKAILSCFEGLIAGDTQPCYFLKFEVDPATIDVNIHPTKNEIKFEYEHEIWPLLVAGIRASLGKNAAVPSIDFNADVVPVAPASGVDDEETPEVEMPTDYNPFNVYNDAGFGNPFSHSDSRQRSNARNWDQLYADFMKKQEVKLEDEPVPEMSTLPGLEQETAFSSQVCLQFGLKYIVTTTREGLIILDQHRAHVKVLYERYLSAGVNETCVSQQLMFPEAVTLGPDQLTALAEVSGRLHSFGFEIVHESDDRWSILAVPSELQGVDARDVLLRILDSVTEYSVNYGADQTPVESLLQSMALEMARASAIKRGHKLTQEEMESLLAELFALPDPAFTPNGNRIYSILDESSIIRLLT